MAVGGDIQRVWGGERGEEVMKEMCDKTVVQEWVPDSGDHPSH